MKKISKQIKTYYHYHYYYVKFINNIIIITGIIIATTNNYFCHADDTIHAKQPLIYRANHDANRRVVQMRNHVFNAAECDEITVQNAGYEKANGVYIRSTDKLPLGGIASYGYFCKNNNCTAGVFNQWGREHNTKYGWGIQVETHHRYYNELVSMHIYQFDRVRKAEGIGGIYPIPNFYCSKHKYHYLHEFKASKCDEITVEGAGYKPSNGVYKRSKEKSLPKGYGDPRYGYFCKGINGNDCYSGIFNQWGTTLFGWGIQNFGHHRYYNNYVSDTIRSPFTKVRLDHPSISGVPPIPSFYCSKYKSHYDQILPFNVDANDMVCDENIPTKHWGHCVLYETSVEIANRDQNLYGFIEEDNATERDAGTYEDFDSFNVLKMKTQIRVTNGPGYKIMKMPSDLFELLKIFFDRTYHSEFTTSHGIIPGEFTNIKAVPMDKIELDDFPNLKLEIIEEMRLILEEWTEQRLKHTSTFGIRVYKRDAMLINHVDQWETHIASAVLQIAQDVEEGWPLEILDKFGNAALVYLQPGDMVLYEGAYFKHGRPMRFKGNMFANIFTHFAPFER